MVTKNLSLLIIILLNRKNYLISSVSKRLLLLSVFYLLHMHSQFSNIITNINSFMVEIFPQVS